MILAVCEGGTACLVFFHQNPIGDTVFFFIEEAFGGAASKRNV